MLGHPVLVCNPYLISTYIGRVAKKNSEKRFHDVFKRAKESMNAVTAKDWAGAVRLATKQEKLYIGNVLTLKFTSLQFYYTMHVFRY